MPKDMDLAKRERILSTLAQTINFKRDRNEEMRKHLESLAELVNRSDYYKAEIYDTRSEEDKAKEDDKEVHKGSHSG